MEEPTIPMRQEAASAGFYKSPGGNHTCPRLQLLTIEELLAGKSISYAPGEKLTFKRTPLATGEDRTETLPLE